MKGILLTLSVLAGVSAQAAPQPVPAAGTTADPAAPAIENWRELARADVLAAYQIYVDNHPGMHDSSNPEFPERLKRAREAGLRVAATATDRGGYSEALGAFSAELMDGHALAFAKQPPASAEPPKFEWPGFIAAWRGDRARVHQAGAGSPAPVGSTIVSCDGRPVRELVQKRLAYRGFRPNEAGIWWLRAPQAFYSTPLFKAHRPERCRFRLPGGQERDAALTYAPAPENFMKLVESATDGERLPIGITEPQPGIFLIAMPDFNPDEGGAKAYEALFTQLESRRAELLQARAIVIDLRHNNGGSSLWSRKAARILWGQEAVDRRMSQFFRNVSIWWRASPGNVSYMEELVASLRQKGRTDQANANQRPAQEMRAALTRGDKFWVQPISATAAAADAPLPPTDFTAPVYVITPGRCASACLDAVDAFTRFPNTKLIGAPTSADSTYMEVRNADLPSGHGRIVIPNKMWAGRPRGAGEVYTPHIPFEALDWSTAAFLERIQEDLAAQGGERG